MQQSIKVSLHSTCPLLLHNGQTADPLNHFSKLLKTISSKRKKTDADFEELARIEWYASLYLSNGMPCLPSRVIEATLTNAAKKVKKGVQAKAGLYCLDDFPLIYDGPTDLEELRLDERFRFTTGVVINRVRVQRCRPKFDYWTADVEVLYSDEQLNESDVLEFFHIGGRDVGLCDWRPKYGRFEVTNT